MVVCDQFQWSSHNSVQNQSFCLMCVLTNALISIGQIGHDSDIIPRIWKYKHVSSNLKV